jgi:CRISPR-associated protein Csm2
MAQNNAQPQAAMPLSDAWLKTSIAFGADLPPDIFSETAEKAAKAVKGQHENNNKRTQLRRFYDELVMWNERVQTEQGTDGRVKKYKEFEPFIKMLKAKVAYAKGRKHVDEKFHALFRHCIDQVDKPESLNHCKLFMEAFMGFYRTLEN